MWRITKAFEPYLKDSVGVSSRNWDASRAVKATARFRMKDDDGILYVEGISTSTSSFAPLDDYGEGGLGCTSIEYLEKGVWKPL